MQTVCSLEQHGAHTAEVHRWSRRGENLGVAVSFPCPGYDGTSLPVAVIKHDSTYPNDRPATTELYFDQGRASFENQYDGGFCFVFLGYGPGHSAALTLSEMVAFRAKLDQAINEQSDLVAKYGEE